MRNFVIAVLLTMASVANGADVDLRPIDKYLDALDRFAQGDINLVPRLNQEWPKAKEVLQQALAAKDRRAPSRVVFLMVVQVGSPMPAASDTGRAWSAYAGDKFPSRKLEGENVFAPWDFYDWWRQNQSPKDDLPLLAQWLSRDFARSTVIPMYEKQLQNGAK